MSSQIIPLYKKVPEKVIKHSLNNTITSIDVLTTKLKEKGYHFLRNQHINRYLFNFYCPNLKIAIEIDGYAHEFKDIHNLDAPKKLYISSLGITVLRFTDYQVLVDIDEIFRAIKNQVQRATTSSYVV
ncbi:endonuclease domain-containing protein [Aquimarina celericrescens]|uniref:Endonuclease domain-containing protein n=1 Tax=Aquimarina celericrescens TaxID=1964542 RepID=A0ABW5B1B0_9FLAO|nr:DUF559 domain-containing protein [Aquimarina celericrescens]